MSANDTQVGGTHYRGVVQHWDFVAATLGEAYFRAVATKYLVRWRKKGGKQDLEKASHYLVKLAELLKVGELTEPLSAFDARHFCVSTGVPTQEAVVIVLVFEAKTRDDIMLAIKVLAELMAGVV